MARLLSLRVDPGRQTRLVGARQPRHQLAKQGALLEVLSETGMRGRDPVEGQHLLDRVGVAEQHHDFLQIRAAHGAPHDWLRATTRARRPANWYGKAGAMTPVLAGGRQVFD
jgi:hypothetical protein